MSKTPNVSFYGFYIDRDIGRVQDCKPTRLVARMFVGARGTKVDIDVPLDRALLLIEQLSAGAQILSKESGR